MSSNSGLAKFDLIGARIATQPIFYPPYRKANGEDVSARLRVTVAINRRGASKPDYLDCIAWGKRAQSLAHFLSVGKEMYFGGHLTSALVPVRDNQGTELKQKATGREKDDNGNPYPVGASIPVKVTKTSFVIENWNFGDDSDNEKNRRPVGWNTPGTDGYNAWRQQVADAKAAAQVPYQGQKDVYGLAKIGSVSGDILIPDANGNMVIAPANVIQNPSMAGAGGADENVTFLAALRAKGWTDEQIRNDSRFSKLAYLLTPEVPSAPEEVPAPPAWTSMTAPTGV